MAKSKTPMADSNARNRKEQQSHMIRAQMLRRLLTVHSEEDKTVINNITRCIKFMHQNYDIETFRLQRVYNGIIREFKGKHDPTHVPEEVFVRLAASALKITNLPQTRLYDKLKLALRDVELGETPANEPEMFSVR